MRAKKDQKSLPLREDNENAITTKMRIGCYIFGLVFLSGGFIDGAMNTFTGSEIFFASTGITLMAIAIKGKIPKIFDNLTKLDN